MVCDPKHPERPQRPRTQDVGVQTDMNPNSRYTHAFENGGTAGFNQKIYDDTQQMDFSNVDNCSGEKLQNVIQDAINYHRTLTDQGVAQIRRHIQTNYSIIHEPHHINHDVYGIQFEFDVTDVFFEFSNWLFHTSFDLLHNLLEYVTHNPLSSIPILTVLMPLALGFAEFIRQHGSYLLANRAQAQNYLINLLRNALLIGGFSFGPRALLNSFVFSTALFTTIWFSFHTIEGMTAIGDFFVQTGIITSEQLIGVINVSLATAGAFTISVRVFFSTDITIRQEGARIIELLRNNNGPLSFSDIFRLLRSFYTIRPVLNPSLPR